MNELADIFAKCTTIDHVSKTANQLRITYSSWHPPTLKYDKDQIYLCETNRINQLLNQRDISDKEIENLFIAVSKFYPDWRTFINNRVDYLFKKIVIPRKLRTILTEGLKIINQLKQTNQ